jgi:spore coat protein SA
LHLLIIAPEAIPVPSSGGSVEICIYHIAKQLARRHAVTIVSRKHSRYPDVTRQGNLTIVRVPAGGYKRYMTNVCKYIRGKRYDFIQVDNRPWSVLAVKRLFPRTPVSLFLHSLTFVSPRTAPCLAKADVIVANSSSLRSRLKQMFPGQKHKIRKVWLGADLNRFTPPSIMQKNSLKRRYGGENTFLVLFIGRVIPRKGVPILIRAIHLLRNKVKNVRLIVTGGGRADYVRGLRNLAASLKVPVTFTGPVAHGRIQSVYRAADCFVCPSQRHEAFGLVNVEAMASGLPVVASDIGGIGEIVSHGKTGFLVKRYSDPGEFARCLHSLAVNPTLRKTMAQAGRASVLQKFSWASTAISLESVYREILRKAQPSF